MQMMNKNPFVPQPSYTPQQPPLPPGPPPPQPAQPDYSAYWAPQQPAYGAQWAAQPPTQAAPPPGPRPPAEQSALYANYGYGAQWQRQQQQQQLQQLQAQYPPPPPVQPPYNPYQPTAGYPPPYAPPPPAQLPQFFHPPPPQQRHHIPLPPAKRQRFDPPPPQPQFQPPPRPAPPPNHVALGPRAATAPGRGASPGGQRGGRGAPMPGPRGAMGAGRGRGGGSFTGGGGGRGGGGGGGSNPLRGHGSRGAFGKDFQNRRGAFSHQGGGGSFRGGRSGQHQPNRPRHDPRDGQVPSFASGSGKKDENRRTLTDFKIVGFEIRDLAWTWGVVKSEPVEEQSADDHAPEPAPALHPLPAPPHLPSDSTPPPSRIRIYFHTPVTPDDARPIPHTASPYALNTPSDSRKGKRKKLEDDDADIDDDRDRARPPPPPPASQDRASVTPSVSLTETASEDWLMAAIVEGDEADTRPTVVEEDEDQLTQILDADDTMDDTVPQPHTPSDGIHVHGPGDVHMRTPEGGLELELAPVLPGTNSENGGANAEGGPILPEPQPAAHGGTENEITTDPSKMLEPTPPAPASTPPVAAVDSTQPTSVGERSDDADADHVALLATQVLDEDSDVDFTAHGGVLTNEKESSLGVGASASASGLEDPATLPPPLDGTDQDDTVNDHEETQTQIDELEGATQEMDHLPEPPASPLTTLSTSAYGGSPTVSVKPEAKAGRVPSANRLSISYAGGNRRLVVDAEVVESLKLFRQEGRIEVLLNVVKDGDDGLKGILVEGLSEITKSYLPLQAICDNAGCDDTLPPFSKASIPSTITLRVYLDTARPLSEPKWAKSGDVQEWLKSMFGRMFWVAGDAAEGWEKKIQVVDPDPPPTIWTVLEGWAANSPAGVLNERQRFLKTHMSETDNILEILLRLVRGERATASYQSGPAISAPSISGPLLSALSHGSAHGAQQTHVSLAVLAMFRMAVEYASKAGGEKGKTEVEERMGEIIRCLPSHLVYKSLDGIFKEWRVEKKGR
ncbi:hypothetical protein H2248_006020 [Termitomyces sp. 'cryptogamus']|nr:hypothetical protein H2248_006020 [Termitomyces sp. 'cryptogamus']